MAKRILFTASTYSHIANFHLPYIRAFRDRGYQVDAACGGAPRELPDVDRVLPLPLKKSMVSPRNLSAVRILRNEIRSSGYDMISCHTALAAFFTRLAVLTLRDRPRVACTVHGYLFDDATSPLRKRLLVGAEQLTAPVTDLLMTMNDWDDVFARKHRLGRIIRAVPGMGVDFAAMTRPAPEEASAFRARLGFTADDFLLVYAAEFSKRKNHALLLRAAAGLPDRVKLLLPGDGVLREETMALARSLWIEDRVVFPGQVSDMPLWYGAADGAVSSSRSEGLPFNIMEAMGVGLPVVASAVKGHTDLITHGETGLLYPPDDEASLRVQVCRLLEDPAFRAALGRDARASMEDYDLRRVLPRVMACYDELLTD